MVETDHMARTLAAAIEAAGLYRNVAIRAHVDGIQVTGDASWEPEAAAYSAVRVTAPLWDALVPTSVPLRVEVGDVAYLTAGGVMAVVRWADRDWWVERCEVLRGL